MPILKRPILFLILVIAISINLLGQSKVNNIWYFGDHSGVDFNVNPPKPIFDSKMYTPEGSASICDVHGNLLFYTNGGNFNSNDTGAIWNRNHEIMPNGKLNRGCYSSMQSALIVQFPADTNKYYVFSNDCVERNLLRGVTYSIVNMSLDGGKGDVELKGVHLESSTNEGMVVVNRPEEKGFWLITHKSQSSTFVIAKFDSSGLDTVLHQDIGVTIGSFCGFMAASKSGSKLAFFSCTMDESFIFNFDKQQGILSPFLQISGVFDYGVFSPNEELLYVNGDQKIFQIDLMSNDSNANKFLLAKYTQEKQMQLGPDGKVYGALPEDSFLSVIHCPNVRGLGCHYVHDGLSLNSNLCWFGLPNICLQNYGSLPDVCSLDINLGNDTIICEGEHITLKVNVDAGQVSWNTGDTTDSITVALGGKYVVTVQNEFTSDQDSINVTLENCSCKIHVPNAFSPNSNSINDKLGIVSTCDFDFFEVKIFNRWGEMIFVSDQSDFRWDGMYRGELIQTGNYIYLIKYKWKNEVEEEIHGHLNVVR